MKRVLFISLCLIALAFFPGCKSPVKPKVSSPLGSQPVYQREAIKLNLKADSRLNLYQNSPHTLLVCVYQLVDPNGFNQLTQEPNGLARLMECGRFEPSVASAKRYIVQPGQEIREVIDRAEGARYLSLAAGYYVVDKGKPFRLYTLPATAGKEPLSIEAYLGSQSIQDMGGK